MIDPKRITPTETKEKMSSEEALLVCAYDDTQKFEKVHLQGAIPLSEFKSSLPSLSKDKEIIFYCA
jgi:rhodanese-related sulfurtransferase